MSGPARTNVAAAEGMAIILCQLEAGLIDFAKQEELNLQIVCFTKTLLRFRAATGYPKFIALPQKRHAAIVGRLHYQGCHQEYVHETFPFQQVDCEVNTFAIKQCSFSLLFRLYVERKLVAKGYQQIVLPTKKTNYTIA